MAPKHNAEAISITKHKEAALYLTGGGSVSDKWSGMIYRAAGCTANVNESRIYTK